MKIFFLCSIAPNQCALANKLHESIGLSRVIAVKSRSSWSRTTSGIVRRLVTGVASRTFGAPLHHAWSAMLARYDKKYHSFPDVPFTQVVNVNADEVLQLIRREQPALILVSGTNLLKADTIAVGLEYGKIMNLHTGISPYVKGGPDCTNMCLALREFDLIGNTVMWIDAGIDSGRLIATERTSLDRFERLSELHFKVMEHAHDLYIRSASAFVARKHLPSILQSELGAGRIFYSKDWRGLQMLKAYYNFVRFYRKDLSARNVKLVSLES